MRAATLPPLSCAPLQGRARTRKAPPRRRLYSQSQALPLHCYPPLRCRYPPPRQRPCWLPVVPPATATWSPTSRPWYPVSPSRPRCQMSSPSCRPQPSSRWVLHLPLCPGGCCVRHCRGGAQGAAATAVLALAAWLSLRRRHDGRPQRRAQMGPGCPAAASLGEESAQRNVTPRIQVAEHPCAPFPSL